MNSRKKPVYRRLLESAQIPEDLSEGAILLHVTGRQEAYIENYKGIMEYTDTRVMLL